MKNKKRSNVKESKASCLRTVIGAVAFCAATASHAARLPDQTSLQRAQQRSHWLVTETERLASVALGGGSQASCSEYDYNACVQVDGCTWRTLDHGERGVCTSTGPMLAPNESETSELDENDRLAGLGLQTLSVTMRGMTRWIDLLAANLRFPIRALQYHVAACQSVRENIVGSIGVATSAALPMPGYITPLDIQNITSELQAVKADLNCLL